MLLVIRLIIIWAMLGVVAVSAYNIAKVYWKYKADTFNRRRRPPESEFEKAQAFIDSWNELDDYDHDSH